MRLPFRDSRKPSSVNPNVYRSIVHKSCLIAKLTATVSQSTVERSSAIPVILFFTSIEEDTSDSLLLRRRQFRRCQEAS